MRTITVTSNCQTAGLATTLREVFPEDKILACQIPGSGQVKSERRLLESLAQSDIWVSLGRHELAEKAGAGRGKAGLRVLKIPSIRFSAFHPDLCYAIQTSTGQLTRPNYNSAIVVWCYQRNIPPDDVPRFFNRETFRELGYLDRWRSSVAALRAAFEKTDLGGQFDAFFLNARRQGLFMHSVNHPKESLIVRLGKLVAQQLGAPAAVQDAPIVIANALVGHVWPLYPEIADALALEGGSYRWKIGDGYVIDGVAAYAAHAYDGYRKANIAPDDINARTGALFDKVLSARAKLS